MSNYKTTYISASVHRAGDNPIVNECSTTITICDEAAGAFISLTDSEGSTIKLDPDEFEIVANVARGMLENFDDGMPKILNAVEGSGVDPNPTGVAEWFAEMRDSLSAAAEANVTPRTAADDRWYKATRDLLAVIHCDGGKDIGKVGIVDACKEAESIVRQLRSDDARSKPGEWTTEKSKKGGIYWVQFDHGLAPQSVEVYRLDEDDVWRARVVGSADIIGSHIASFQVNSLTNALWYGPLSAPPMP